MSDYEGTELKYEEFRKDGKNVDITFTKICPDSSGTIEKQKTKKKGLSIVVFFSNEDKKRIRDDIISQIQDLDYGFVPTSKLHCTFLTLSSKDSFPESNNHYNDLIKEHIENFLKVRKNEQNHNIIELTFDEVRPGTWHGRDQYPIPYGRDQYPIPYASDGTVVAMGKPCTEGNEEFVNLAYYLIDCLKIRLNSIFGGKFDRKFSTIWSTLGYFDHRYFNITQSFANTFYRFKRQYSDIPLKINVEKLSLVEYSYKDLSDANILKIYEL